MTQPTRTVELTYSCPRCGGPVQGTEAALAVAELSQPVSWKLVSRYCVNGCQLTVSDWPPDLQM